MSYINSDVLIHHISPSRIPLHMVHQTFLHSLHFWSSLNSLRKPLGSDFASVGLPICSPRSLINTTCGLGNTRAELSLYQFLTNSTANSYRSCHGALPNANLNLSYFIQITPATLRADSLCLSLQLQHISPLPARCESCSWGELHAATNTRLTDKRAMEHHLLHIYQCVLEAKHIW